MQQLIQFGRALKKIMIKSYVIQFFNTKKLSDFCHIFPIIRNTFKKNK